jgi:hypothetical protein
LAQVTKSNLFFCRHKYPFLISNKKGKYVFDAKHFFFKVKKVNTYDTHTWDSINIIKVWFNTFYLSLHINNTNISVWIMCQPCFNFKWMSWLSCCQSIDTGCCFSPIYLRSRQMPVWNATGYKKKENEGRVDRNM